jgi:hypothetical protein
MSMSAAERTDERHDLIARAAYLKAEKRGFVGGDPLEDWLSAEAEVEAQLRTERGEKARPDFRQYTHGQRRDALEKTLGELRKKGRAKRDELKHQAEHVLDELKRSLDKLHTGSRGKRQ